MLWGYVLDINRIFVLQQRAVRAILKRVLKVFLRDKFKVINILTLASHHVSVNVI